MEYSFESGLVIESASEEAIERNHEFLLPSHMFYSCITRGSSAVDFLNDYLRNRYKDPINIPEFRGLIKRELIDTIPEADKDIKRPMGNPAFDRMMLRLEDDLMNLGYETVEERHILLSVVFEEQSRPAQFLARHLDVRFRDLKSFYQDEDRWRGSI